METTEVARTEVLLAYIRAQLSAWHKHHPTRVIMTVSIRQVPELTKLPREQVTELLTELDGYVGSANKDAGTPHPIPYNYELHAYPLTGIIEVVLLTRKFHTQPTLTLIADLSKHILAQSSAMQVDDQFILSTPNYIVDYVDDLPTDRRASFYTKLRSELKKAGLALYVNTGDGMFQPTIRRTH